MTAGFSTAMLLFACCFLFAACGGSSSPNGTKQYASLAAARSDLGTKLTKHGGAPQEYENTDPPAGEAEVLTYKSGGLELKGWLVSAKREGKNPALVFLHGGFAFGSEDVEQVVDWVEDGWVVFVPILRGENGQAGDYDLFFHEIDDVVAAGEFVAALDYVDKDAIYVMGHSVGGTRALLASMLPGPFAAAASIGGAPDFSAWLEGQPELAPFDLSDPMESWMRSPKEHIADIHIPLIVARGTEEGWNKEMTADFVARAKQAGKDVEQLNTPGDHFTCFDRAQRLIREKFKVRLKR